MFSVSSGRPLLQLHTSPFLATNSMPGPCLIRSSPSAQALTFCSCFPLASSFGFTITSLRSPRRCPADHGGIVPECPAHTWISRRNVRHMWQQQHGHNHTLLVCVWLVAKFVADHNRPQ